MRDKNKQILLARRPQGAPEPGDFELVKTPAPEPGDGEFLARTLYLSLDPYMRGRMNAERSYSAPVKIGGVMEGGTVSRVEVSNHRDYAAGDIVIGRAGWQEYALSNGAGMRKVRAGNLPLSTALGVLGMPGMTAYTGLLNIGQPKDGDTLVVAAASGAVGGIVGQIARIKGCRVVGVAGSRQKCRYVVEELGFDACLNHHDDDFEAALAAACPDGVDIYFENVAGRVLRAVIPLFNFFARMPVCGLISQYNAVGPSGEPDHLPALMRAMLTNRIAMRGFIVTDFAAQQDDFLRDVGRWVADGRIKYREHRVAGLEAAPQALIGLLQGENFGKVIVEVSPASG
ncbi:MAG: NADPH-dependent curcumin reductase [Alphaproteobacteria bacterium MarineAlpha10_Bin3]|nr:MAG: NADPH-dependent curcumin reductase [Alphaproteobacteria bacterium MarineAlpha10_Bin3]PPR71955.1 MAG: NADPH-dependent curcumin reductase [Alphaproteobacteria bacterium MarineAlpha4_Bin1]